MKVPLLKFGIWATAVVMGLSLYGCEDLRKKMSLAKAMRIAQESVEVQTLADMLGSGSEKCLSLVSEEACDSDYVTCVEDAWVIYAKINPNCVTTYEERLQVSLLIDYDGNIMSRYPGEGYFTDPKYCTNDDECYIPSYNHRPVKKVCENFMHASLRQGKGGLPDPYCKCRKNRCEP